MRRCLAVLLAGGLAASAHALAASKSGTAASPAARAAHSGVQVKARVRGLLYPGVRRPLLVRVRNPTRRPVTVGRVTVTVKQSPWACPRRSVRLGGYRGRLRIAPHGRARLRLHARMVAHAPNACQGATFDLHVRARARIARRR